MVENQGNASESEFRGAEKVIGGSNNLRKIEKRINYGEIYSMEFIREVEFIGRDVVVPWWWWRGLCFSLTLSKNSITIAILSLSRLHNERISIYQK